MLEVGPHAWARTAEGIFYDCPLCGESMRAAAVELDGRIPDPHECPGCGRAQPVELVGFIALDLGEPGPPTRAA